MKRVSSLLCVVAFAVGVAGCGTNRDATRIQGIVNDPFSPAIEIDGAFLWSNPFGGPTRKWYLVSLVDRKTQAVTHELYFYINYRPPMARFQFAADDIARELPVVKIEHSRDCSGVSCLEYESIGVVLDEQTLRGRMLTGYKIKVSARDGTAYVLEITPRMIQLQVDALENVLKSPPIAPPPK